MTKKAKRTMRSYVCLRFHLQICVWSYKCSNNVKRIQCVWKNNKFKGNNIICERNSFFAISFHCYSVVFNFFMLSFHLFEVIFIQIICTFKVTNQNNAKRQVIRKQRETVNSKSLKVWTSRQLLEMCLP